MKTEEQDIKNLNRIKDFLEYKVSETNFGAEMYKFLNDFIPKLESNPKVEEVTEDSIKEWLDKQRVAYRSVIYIGDKLDSKHIELLDLIQKALNHFKQEALIPSKKKGVDLEKLSKKVDEVLESETPESLTKWLEEHRKSQLSNIKKEGKPMECKHKMEFCDGGNYPSYWECDKCGKKQYGK